MSYNKTIKPKESSSSNNPFVTSVTKTTTIKTIDIQQFDKILNELKKNGLYGKIIEHYRSDRIVQNKEALREILGISVFVGGVILLLSSIVFILEPVGNVFDNYHNRAKKWSLNIGKAKNPPHENLWKESDSNDKE